MENKEEIIFIRKYGLFTTIWIFFIVALLIVDPILVSMDFQDPIKSVLKIGIYIYILFMLIYSILIGFSTFLKFNKKERFQTRNFIFLILGLLMFLFPIVILAGICLAGGDLFFMSYIPDVVEPVESSGSEYDVISAFLLEDYYVNSIITLSVSFLLLFFGGITILFFINTHLHKTQFFISLKNLINNQKSYRF